MEHKIIFATSNEGKMREIREILKSLGAEILSLKEAGVHVDIVEDGDSFEANAIIKAKAVWEKTGGIVQGMSGSPIIQNGKLVGAVTHVLINDPTRGYGIFIENMLEEAG